MGSCAQAMLYYLASRLWPLRDSAVAWVAVVQFQFSLDRYFEDVLAIPLSLTLIHMNTFKAYNDQRAHHVKLHVCHLTVSFDHCWSNKAHCHRSLPRTISYSKSLFRVFLR